MVKALFDTNILIDYLNGIDEAARELTRYSDRAISVVTWMEVMVGIAPEEADAIRAWLRSFDVIGLDAAVAGRAVAIRRAHRIRLPDAIVWASAQARSLLLVSRNTKNFPESDPGVRVPYRLS